MIALKVAALRDSVMQAALRGSARRCQDDGDCGRMSLTIVMAKQTGLGMPDLKAMFPQATDRTDTAILGDAKELTGRPADYIRCIKVRLDRGELEVTNGDLREDLGGMDKNNFNRMVKRIDLRAALANLGLIGTMLSGRRGGGVRIMPA